MGFALGPRWQRNSDWDEIGARCTSQLIRTEHTRRVSSIRTRSRKGRNRAGVRIGAILFA